MISKVNSTSAQTIQQYQTGQLRKSDAEEKAAGAAAPIAEQVHLSSKANEIRQINQLLNQTADVREDRIKELRDQITSGTYQVSAEKIAGKMAGESLINLIA